GHPREWFGQRDGDAVFIQAAEVLCMAWLQQYGKQYQPETGKAGSSEHLHSLLQKRVLSAPETPGHHDVTEIAPFRIPPPLCMSDRSRPRCRATAGTSRSVARGVPWTRLRWESPGRFVDGKREKGRFAHFVLLQPAQLQISP
ncbi:MAG: hypothetical protein Q8L91_14190, partial [Polaromonas sp.]|nr:hypothetical protein [Polaromonas sp.]